MNENTFDKLTLGISQQERLSMLSKLEENIKGIETPFYNRAEIENTIHIESQFKELPFLKKLLFYIQSFFSGVNAKEYFKESIIKDLGKRIDHAYPGLIGIQNFTIQNKFREECINLKKAFDYFGRLLSQSVDRDRGAFYSYLVSLELVDVYGSLLSDTNPEQVAKDNPGKTELDIRRLLNDRLEEIFFNIVDSQKKKVYSLVRTITCLSQLRSFNYQSILNGYVQKDQNEQFIHCTDIAEALKNFADILYSLNEPPSLSLLESLLFFTVNDKKNQDIDSSYEDIMKTEIKTAKSSIETINNFFKAIPLCDIVRYANKDPVWMPNEIAGGEDWFLIFKNYSKQLVEKQWMIWERNERRVRLKKEIEDFLGSKILPNLEYISQVENEIFPPIKLEYALKLLNGFLKGPFLSFCIRPLKILLLDGEFYKKENRFEYTEAFNQIQKLESDINLLNNKCSPQGEYGKVWQNLYKEIVPIILKQQQLSIIYKQARQDADQIVKISIQYLSVISQIINGVLFGEVNGRYDTISNISYIDGKNNQNFKRMLGETKIMFEKLITILRELSSIEALEEFTI